MNIAYSSAMEELKKLVAELEKGQVSIDELSIKLKSAATMIKVCKDKLTTTEEDVEVILREIGEYTM